MFKLVIDYIKFREELEEDPKVEKDKENDEKKEGEEKKNEDQTDENL